MQDGRTHTAAGAAGEAPHVFVYGTLKPGHLRWPLLEPFVVAHFPATVTGRLYDTGVGYPAARFDEAGTIDGVLCRLDPASSRQAWALLDRVEGAQYRRILVTAALAGDPGDAGGARDLGDPGVAGGVVVDGGAAAPPVVAAGSYEFVAGHAGMADLGGRWDGI